MPLFYGKKFLEALGPEVMVLSTAIDYECEQAVIAAGTQLRNRRLGREVYPTHVVKAPMTGTAIGYDMLSIEDASSRLYHQRDTIIGLQKQIREAKEKLI